MIVRIIFSSILQIWYVEVRISRGTSESPLEFEIMRVVCILSWLQIRLGIHILFLLFFHKNLCCGFSLEVPCWGASKDYPQHMWIPFFSSFNWINYFIWSGSVKTFQVILDQFNLFVCLCWGFTAQSTQWGHVEHSQFTWPHVYWTGLVL